MELQNVVKKVAAMRLKGVKKAEKIGKVMKRRVANE